MGGWLSRPHARQSAGDDGNRSPHRHAVARSRATPLQDRDSSHDLVRSALTQDASREWRKASATQEVASAAAMHSTNATVGCTAILRHYGLCDPTLFRVPPAHYTRYADGKWKPFVFLHLSKCAGTAMISSLSYLGYASFSANLPPSLATASACAAGVSPKCCWWRERLQNMSARDGAPKFFEQEPANDNHWFDPERKRVVNVVDPGFEASADFCADLAYMTILRPPLQRVHSHMCELGVNVERWQRASKLPTSVKPQLRDNYYVRSLGGKAAWTAPEGAITRRHLRSAARTLARFDVVMTVGSLARDSPVQMARVGLPGFRWPRISSRSRSDNLQRAAAEPGLRTRGRPSCEVPPTPAQLSGLVAACTWDAVLYEFARVLAARRTEAYSSSALAYFAAPRLSYA